MIKKTLFEILKNEDSLSKKIKKIIKLSKYFKNLQNGINSGKIFNELENQNLKIENLLNKLSNNDLLLIEKLYSLDVKEFLGKQKLVKTLDFDKEIGLKQVGLNSIFLRKPIIGLWTTGKAAFFLPTKKNTKCKISISLYSIPPLKVTIGFEKKVIKTLSMPKLSTKTIDFTVNKNEIKDYVSELFITTDKLWLPNVILDIPESISLGIGVKSIKIIF